MKIILSRKGFDSSYGGGASPILPNGDLVSLPIPAGKQETGIPYAEIQYNGRSYAALMQELGVKLPESQCCHLDPDLVRETYPRGEGWTGVFGQHGAAASHLNNQKVGIGDLFLFFGSFKRTYEHEGKLSFERDYERHIIFGFLYVDQMIHPHQEAIPGVFHYHPHITHTEEFGKLNTLYVAKNNRFGTFSYDDKLVLTRLGFSKSQWELPMYFHPERGTHIRYPYQSAFRKRFWDKKWASIAEFPRHWTRFCGSGK